MTQVQLSRNPDRLNIGPQLKDACLLLAQLAQETLQSMGPERFYFPTVAKETCTLLYCLLIEMK